MDTQITIPTLDSLPQVATFAAFKEAERISFVRPYDPKVVGIEGYRHAVVRWRQTDKNTAAKPAQMVTIPQIKLTDEYLMPEVAASLFVGLLEDEQDSIIRSLIEQKASSISWDSLTLEKVIESLTAVRTSSRLTKEQITAWANVAMLEACNTRADQISEAKGYNDEQKKKQRAGTLNAYVALAAKLAAPVPNMGQNEATALSNMLEVAKLDDDIAKVLKKKLHAILNPQVVETGDL